MRSAIFAISFLHFAEANAISKNDDIERIALRNRFRMGALFPHLSAGVPRGRRARRRRRGTARDEQCRRQKH